MFWKRLTYLYLIAAFIGIYFVVAETGGVQTVKPAPHGFPRIANYYLHWSLTESQARQLAKWDLVVLDVENQYRNPDMIKKLRQLNPDIVILGYITPQEIIRDAPSSFSTLRRRLSARIPDAWYLHNSAGERLHWWPGTWLLNVTEDTPLVNGQRFHDFLVSFVIDEVLSTDLWDGIFYDNAWDNITYFAGKDVDYNGDGRIDSALDEKWREGMRYIYTETRRRAPKDTIIVGNGTTRAYQAELDGNIIENFTTGAWAPSMETYRSNSRVNEYNIINRNTGNKGGSHDYRSMRFGLGSTLLEDGYYSYDFGDQDHGQLWYYDEYDIDLGEPQGESFSKNSHTAYAPDVWRRDFTNGIAVVNSTDQNQRISLGGEFEKITGSQDPAVNDGAIVTELDVSPHDALILLKTFSSLDDVLFTNGSFARFLTPAGERVRNGLFIFEEAYRGGYQIAHVDLDGNGKRDLLVVRSNSILAWRDDGLPFMKVYPYTADYEGELRVAIGDLNHDGYSEIYVAPSEGYALPIKVYNRDGLKIKRDWYPFGEDYRGGYSLAIGDLDNEFGENVIIGTGTGRAAEVFSYDFNYEFAGKFRAFANGFTGGVRVAAGNLNTDRWDEIVVGAGPGKAPEIRVFSAEGTLLSEFMAYTTLAKPGVTPAVLDVDFDGDNDIVAFSSGVGL